MAKTSGNSRSRGGSDSDPYAKKRDDFPVWLLLMVVFIVGIAVIKTLQAGDPLVYMVPNFLMFTPFREATKTWWRNHLKIDMNKEVEMTRIPEMQAKDFTFEKLRVLTQDFRYPAVVKGLFLGTRAVENWKNPGYLKEKIGDMVIPVVNDARYNTLQNNRGIQKFGDAYDEVLTNEDSKKYMFFPVKSRFNYNHSELGKLEIVQQKVNTLVAEDMDLDRIWPGFGKHKNYYGSQLIAGRGSNEETTGTGWHCAIGSNFFVQVAGTKRWMFMDPKYSALMSPGRGGKVNMMTTVTNMADLHKHIPLRYSDIETGDLLYNPDWEWHTIKNHEGLSIGVPIREVNLTLSFRNNFQYSSIVMANLGLSKIGIDIGGYPAAA